MSVRPKKHLGQHFLHDQHIARKIVEAFREASTSRVLEVGPGQGILTGYLLEYFGTGFYAVEIDRESGRYLMEKFPRMNDYLILEDFLSMDFARYFEGPFSLIGNFPYNISSQIFFRVLEQRHHIPLVVGMVQKEVAARLAAGPGSKTYGKLSVLLQAYYDVKVLFHVAPGSFRPPPRVTSSVIRLRRNGVEELECDEDWFFRVVKQSFNQRRKILRNSLKSFLLNLDLEDERFNKRPEQLDVKDFVEITGKITAARS